MTKQAPDNSTIGYAVRLARRLQLREQDVTSMVEAAVRGRKPQGLSGAVGSDILATLAAFESLRSIGWEIERVLALIKQHAGSIWNPDVVAEFLGLVRDDAVESLARMRLVGDAA